MQKVLKKAAQEKEAKMQAVVVPFKSPIDPFELQDRPFYQPQKLPQRKPSRMQVAVEQVEDAMQRTWKTIKRMPSVIKQRQRTQSSAARLEHPTMARQV